MSSLELVPTDELVEEILSRCDAGLVYLLQDDSRDGFYHNLFQLTGSPLLLAGMAANAQRQALDLFDETGQEEGEEYGTQS